jgi:RimJ/RimL family protein N-acetyltransferase
MTNSIARSSHSAANKNFWQGEKIRLRAIEPEDAPSFFAWNLDSEMARVLDYLWPPGSMASQREWTQRTATAEIKEDKLYLVMEDQQGNAVGMISTHATNRRVGSFAYGLTVGEEHRGRGYASEAVIMLLRYFFEELRYQKVTVTVYECNPASIALHEKLGYQLEGRVRRMVYTGGRYYDELYYGMTCEEFWARYGVKGSQDVGSPICA